MEAVQEQKEALDKKYKKAEHLMNLWKMTGDIGMLDEATDEELLMIYAIINERIRITRGTHPNGRDYVKQAAARFAVMFFKALAALGVAVSGATMIIGICLLDNDSIPWKLIFIPLIYMSLYAAVHVIKARMTEI